MSTLDEIMRGPRLKVERATRHIDELRRRTSPLDRELYEIGVKKVPSTVIHAKASDYELAYRPQQPIPETFALIIGDAIHNLRAALDHFGKGVLRAWNPEALALKKSGRIDPPSFPVAPRKDLKARPGLAAIEKVLPGFEKLLFEEVRPENGANEGLWEFYSLDNDDKHSLVIPTVTLVGIHRINARTPDGGFMEDCFVVNDAARVARIMTSYLPITIDNEFKTAVNLKFSEGGLFENESVIPTLTQISDVVDKALDAFERLIRETKGLK